MRIHALGFKRPATQSGILNHSFPMESFTITGLIMLTAFFVLAFYFILLHLQAHIVTIMKATSMLDGVNEIYGVLATEDDLVYAGLVVRLSVYRCSHSSDIEIQDERPDVDSSEGKQDATTLPPRLEDDATSVLSELTEISEPRTPRDDERYDEESEADVSSIPRTLHRLTFASPRSH
jgi:hypothetical protein